MVETREKASSGTAKTALGLGAAALGLNLLNGGAGGLLGAPLAGRAYAPPAAFAADPTGGFVTDKEMCLIREGSSKDSIIAQLTAEKYADNAIKEYDRTEVEPLKTRVCDLETAAAVNAARDKDFRRYVDREFVHQPKATMRESIVVCQQCGCDCGDHHHGCH